MLDNKSVLMCKLGKTKQNKNALTKKEEKSHEIYQDQNGDRVVGGDLISSH